MAFTPATLNAFHSMNSSVPTLFTYTSTDSRVTIEGSGYFTDGAYYGLKAGDVMIVNSGAESIAACTLHVVISATSIRAVTLS
jgi:hypothetical protein